MELLADGAVASQDRRMEGCRKANVSLQDLQAALWLSRTTTPPPILDWSTGPSNPFHLHQDCLLSRSQPDVGRDYWVKLSHTKE